MTTIWIIWFKQPNGYVGYETRKTYPTATKLADRFKRHGNEVFVHEQQVVSPFGPPTYTR